MTVSGRARLPELALVTLGFALLTVGFTWPLAIHPGSLGRVDNFDGQFSIWNVAWVARTLVVDPLNVFDANIFHPHRGTLAYSEANLGAGFLAIPAYWLTGSPYVAHNFVLLLSFVASGVASYALVRHLAGDRRAAWIAATCFAFCPYLFGHIPHIQLLMTAGLPLVLLAFHRLADEPSPSRGLALGLAMAVQTVLCAYYGIFTVLIAGYAVLFTAGARRLWMDRAYWVAVATAAGVALALTIPLALPYLALQSDSGFSRSLDAAREYSASWSMYFGSYSYVHAPMMSLAGRPGELLFPGAMAVAFAAIGAALGWRRGGRSRELAIFYVAFVLIAFWLSYGPAGGLYSAMYSAVPGFTFMRAPSRFGLLVVLGVSVLAGLGVAAMLRRSAQPAMVATLLAVMTIAELVVPVRLTAVPPMQPVYATLATMPRGPVLELPVYSHQFRFARTQYMLNSTAHWMPLIDAYSDHIPSDFQESLPLIADFPSAGSFKRLETYGLRYAVFHLDKYTSDARDTLMARLQEFGSHLRRLHADETTLLYEVVGFP